VDPELDDKDPALAPTEAVDPAVTRVVRGGARPARPTPAPAPAPAPALDATVPSGAAVPASDAAALSPGTVVAGQYRIVAELGAGGMGVVYRAHDVRLGRDVALKLCRALGAGALARFEREAVALARLSHPNVVTVYQVGEQAGRLFIVMEAVPGGTARAWAAGRSWRELVALYALAGEGLAAAHEAGLVHRDFKPDNVLVGDDGRPRVADFGLAYAAADASGEVRALGSGVVTGTGTIMGTPAYMPPEQRVGKALDARADQYSFCVALWEALFDLLPYSNPGASSSEELRTGKHARAALGGPVSRHVVDALRRGLSAVPADRWPSMAALVAELRRDPRVRRRRIALAAGGAAVVLAAGAVLLAVTRPAGSAPCDDGPERLAPVWSPQRAAALAETVGAAAWASLGTALSAYADAWVAGHAEACGAARSAGAPSDRRMACLARSRAELDGFLAELVEYPRQAPGLEALGRLTAPGACAVPASGITASSRMTGAREALAAEAETPPPADPAMLARVERAAHMIARAQTALVGGAQARASLLTNDALALARVAGWRVQIAQALAARAWALEDSGRTTEARGSLEEAVAIALAERSDAVATSAIADLAELLASDGRGDEARRMLTTARSLWERRRDPGLGSRLAGAEVQVALSGGRVAAAVAGARARAREAATREPPELAVVSAAHLARVLLAADAYEEAAGIVERGIAVTEQRLGPHAATLGPALVVLVAARLKLGRFDAALEAARRAVAIAELDGAEGIRMSSASGALGEASRATGDLPAARAAFERALRIERALGLGRRSDVAQAEHNLALVEVAAGDLAQAGMRGAEALATLETMHGTDRKILIPALVLVGYVARERGELAASEAHLRRAAAIGERQLGPDHYDTVNSRIELASTLVRAKRAREAALLLEPIARSSTTTPATAAEARFGLARALDAAGGDRGRARALATDARDRYRALGEAMAPQAAEIARWLAASAAGKR